jgi:hypothetical protein
MEVHAHSHTERKRWTHYLWEFLMLFLAVSLGFLAENMREHSVEHQRAKEYARLLWVDISNDTMQIGQYIRQSNAELTKFENYRGLSKKTPDSLRISDLKRRDFSLPLFKSHNATLTQLNNSGSLRYFSDISLKSGLANYEWMIKDIDRIVDFSVFNGEGINSNYLFQYNIHLESFLNKAAIYPDTMLAKKAGYDFFFYEENKDIILSVMESVEALYKIYYPQLLEQAVSILKLLEHNYNIVVKGNK